MCAHHSAVVPGKPKQEDDYSPRLKRECARYDSMSLPLPRKLHIIRYKTPPSIFLHVGFVVLEISSKKLRMVYTLRVGEK